ncbi:MAG: helix-turn-helix transcriptional regulator [Bacillota bacterium]
MGRTYTRIYRLLRLMAAINSKRGLHVAELARRCEVHERTIYRDIETLNASGIPCSFDAGSGGYRVAAGFFMPPIELTFEEAMAIVALLEEVGDGAQIPFLGAAARAAEKIRSQLPAAVLEAVEPTDGRVHIDLARSSGDDSCRDVYDDMRDAIARRRVLICSYEGASSRQDEDGEISFELRPYALWFCQRAWYVVGLHGGRNAIRRLKLNRFTSVEVTDKPYAIPEGFDLHADLGLAWRMIRGEKRYRVAIRFEPGFADTASETRWHPTQEEAWDHEAGTVTLHFVVDGLDEIVWWVLGYGPGAMVLEPPELIDRVRDLARATAERYRKEIDTSH